MRKHKDHTRRPEKLCNTSDRNYKNCLGIFTNLTVQTQLKRITPPPPPPLLKKKERKKSRKHQHVPGRLYWLSAPSWKPLLFTMKKLQIPWQLLGVQPSTELADQAPWNLPSPSCTSLTPSLQRTSPRLSPQITEFSIQMEHFYILELTFFPQIFYGQEHPHPQYPPLDPDPCRSWEYKDNFTAPRILKLLKRNLQSLMTR